MRLKKYFLVLAIVLIAIAIVINVFLEKNITLKVDNETLSFNNEEEKINIEKVEDINLTANVPIFMYHWIREDTGGYEYAQNMVKSSELKKQFEYLAKNNYDVIFVSDLDSLQHHNKPVILTFDDGWEDVYLDAFPLAKEYNIKICMYVITDLVGTHGYCTLDELREMRDSGLVEIDSHTLSHRYLATLSVEEITKELVQSKKYLKENLDIDSTVICYPSGSSDDVVEEVASKYYKYGLLMTGGAFNYDSNVSDMYAIPRIYAMRSMTLNTFANYCEDSYVKIN